ncbi:MAG: hypothetical protein E7246_00535 [Lachnoclostridium sp.]|nr:hypothetical protein [Lachnoclostridium sp.]
MKIRLYNMIALVLICIPIVSFVLFNNRIVSNNENRVLAEKPELTLENIRNFPSAYEEYFNDHLPFKDVLVKVHSYLSTIVLKSSSNPNVILGKENWLFFDSKNSGDGDELADYMGTNLYSEEELEDTVQNVVTMYENVSSLGIEFYLFIAPNKSTIYSEYMPDYYEKGTNSRVEQLVEALKAYPQINVVYAKDILDEYKVEYQLYHKYDTHWNHLGGYLGTQALLEAMGKETTPISEVSIKKEIRDKSYDLAFMLNLVDYYDDDYWYTIENYNPEIDVEETVTDRVSSSDYNSFFKTNHMDDRTVMVCRDSFGGATFDILPKNFEETIYIHRNLWKDEYLKTYEPDIFVFEFVERHTSVLPYFLQDRMN